MFVTYLSIFDCVRQARKFHEFVEPPDSYSNTIFFEYWSIGFYPHPLFEFETDKKSYRRAGMAQWVQKPGYRLVCPGLNPGKRKRCSVLQNAHPDSGPQPVSNLYRGF